MPDRRRVVAKAIIAAGAYLHPNFYVGDQGKKMWQIQSDAPIADIDANFLESWMWAKHPVIGGRARKLNFRGVRGHDDSVGIRGDRTENVTGAKAG